MTDLFFCPRPQLFSLSRSSKLLSVVGMVFLWALTGMGLNLAVAAELYVTDSLTFPSKSVELQARLTEDKDQGEEGLSKEELEFFVQGRSVGRSMTDEEGWARLAFTPRMRGNLQILVKRITPSKVDSIQAKGRLLSWERRRPILLIDLAVVSQTNMANVQPLPEGVPDPGFSLGKPQKEASAELGKLAKFYYNLVYLDFTGKGELETIQIWLRQHQFPPGRIQILSNGSTALPELLLQLQDEGWENVSGGIGRTVVFAEVLVKNRLQAVIVSNSASSDDGFPRRAIILPDWSRVRRYL